jgi:hypothetical protein
MEKHHLGDVRDSDGKVFLSYRKKKLKDGSVAVYENWVTKEKFEEIKVKRIKQQTEYRKLPKHKARMQRYRKEYRKNAHGSKWIKDYRKNYYEKNRERLLKEQKEYCKNPEVKKLINKQRVEKKKTNPQFAIACRLRNRILKALKLVGAVKSKSTMELLGCSFEFLKQHIENQFRDGMCWEDRSSFHIDHIRPLDSFDLTDSELLKAACHWTNLQPLPPLENIRKSNKFYPDTRKEAA